MTQSLIGTPPRRWSVPETQLAIEYAPEALEEILTYAQHHGQGPKQLSRGGVEVGGVLFGARGENLVRIVTWRPIECEHARGPSFQLSERDRTGLGQLLQRAKSSPALGELHAVGWFVSHTRGEIALTDSDLDIYSHYFPWSWQIALVLKLVRGGPAKAGFFFRGADGRVKSDSSYQEFEIDSLRGELFAPEPETAPPLPITEMPVREMPPPARLPAPAKKHIPNRRIWIWTLPLLMAAVVLAMLLHKPAARQPLGPISFRVVDNGGELRLQWDKTADAVREAVRATIEIKDGDTDLDLPLDLDRLRTGHFAYARKSGDVELLITVYPANAPPVQESARFVAPSANASVGQDAQLRRERDSYAAENARLRASLDQEKGRYRELERLVRILENRLGIKGTRTAHRAAK